MAVIWRGDDHGIEAITELLESLAVIPARECARMICGRAGERIGIHIAQARDFDGRML